MTPAEFKTAFPVFADEDPNVVQRHLDAATAEVTSSSWGSQLNLALGNVTAHFIVMEKQANATGPSSIAGDVIYKRQSSGTGELIMTREPGSVKRGQEEPFMRTFYGQAYLRLAKAACVKIQQSQSASCGSCSSDWSSTWSGWP